MFLMFVLFTISIFCITMYYTRGNVMVISIRMTNEEKELATAYAKLNGASLSEAMKRAYFEKIEEEYDIALADKALREYEKDHKSYSHEEVKKILGL